MTINQLRLYIAVVETGSITKAALSMHISEPAVSKSLKHLEEELGCKLIYKDSSAWILTEFGKEVFNKSKEIIELCEDVHRSIKE